MTFWYRGGPRGTKAVALEVSELVRRAADVFDAKVGDEPLKVVASMLLAVAMKRETMAGRNMVM